MTPVELKARTQAFGLRIIRLVSVLPKSTVANVIGKQMLRSGTSVGANYRAACRAQSTAHFVSKLAIVEEEADETLYWLEMLTKSGLMDPARVEDLAREANALIAIVSASRMTARKHASRTAKSQNQPVNRQSTTGNRKSYET
jgi:four helix bundle protein